MEEYNKLGRRSYLKRLGVLAGIVTTGTVGVVGADDDVPESLEQFHVEGTVKTQVKYTPDTVEVIRRKKSPDLARRYDLTPPVLEASIEVAVSSQRASSSWC
jgi:hypothetical protein